MDPLEDCGQGQGKREKGKGGHVFMNRREMMRCVRNRMEEVQAWQEQEVGQAVDLEQGKNEPDIRIVDIASLSVHAESYYFYRLDGGYYTYSEGVLYLLGCGFSASEATEYIRSLRTEFF